mmetsp:Transcript_99191/g.319862  ORF Transcript_99191/g.319862 Transcript_99191/m.319862 type:complete len:455 (+) Transcript_99191:140-1504(+)
MEIVHTATDAARDLVFPLSATLLALYPVVLLIWNFLEGRAAVEHHGTSAAGGSTKLCLVECCGADTKLGKPLKTVHSKRCPGAQGCSLAAAAALLTGFSGAALAESSLGFVSGAGGCSLARGKMAVGTPAAGSDAGPQHGAAGSGAPRAAGALAAAAAVLACSAASCRPKPQRLGGSVAMGRAAPARRQSGPGAPQVVSEVLAPVAERPQVQLPRSLVAGAEASLWHDIDLYVRSWFDEKTGLLHYVNEIPLGTLKKYEVQPREPGNVIKEDMKGSRRLKAFGRPVPFNYGCFPQTYRDPEQMDKLYSAPGDDDPLDVFDLSEHASPVGTVVRCRVLGAVCLIDEGQADWKVLVVSTDGPGPLAAARSVEDVERIAPGRIQECLSWMDDFKKSSGRDTATLHWEIHGVQQAHSLIEFDHTCWRRLVAEAGPDGTARGHWIHQPQLTTAMLGGSP